jgi:chemotaxis protein MotA
MAGERSTRVPNHDKVSRTGRIDKGTIVGVLLAFGGIIGGLILEKGSLSDITQLTAAMIVFGGTIGAVLIGTPIPEFLAALRQLRVVFLDPGDNSREILEQVISYATKARRSGIVSLESDAEKIEDPFLRKALGLAIDGAELTELKNMMQLDIEVEERRMLSKAKVYESAGGYCPTIGIIGAVLGLIQVMKNLANIEEVGRGIAVAFVATVYGVGAANILFIPAGNKIRNHAKRRMETMELMMEGVLGIVEGMNPKMIRRKLESLAEASSSVASAKQRIEEISADIPAGEKA